MKIQLSFLSFIFSLLISDASFAQRIGSAQEEWKRIRTTNFDIIFTAKHQDLGLYYAQTAERALNELSTVFSYKPRRIVLVVNDTTDISNGFATRIPYPYVMAYSVPISDHETLSEAGEWGHELVVHELTHILQLEPAHGFYKWLRPIFGTIIAPNMLLPLWWKEGMAVEMETQFSHQGRLRSTYQDAAIRAFVIDQKLFQYTIAEANEVLPSYPFGSRPYLFGSVFFSSLVRDTSLKSTDTLALRHGERIPYAIEEPMRELTGRNYESQYTKGLFELQRQAQDQLDQLAKWPFSSLQPLNSSSYTMTQPRWSSAFKILATVENPGDDEQIFFYDEKFQPLKFKKVPSGTIGHIEWHPQQKKIFFTKTRLVDSSHMFSDIFEYNLETSQSEALTDRQRAREISVSPDGKEIVFISTEGGQTSLKVLELESKKVTTLLTSDFYHRLGSPLYLTQQQILYTSRNSKGQQSLYQISPKEKTPRKIDLKISQPRFLRRGQIDGKSVLYFVSNDSGVQNIYLSIDLKNARPITHLQTAAFSFDVDEIEKKLHLTHLTGDGFRISTTQLVRSVGEIPKIKNSWAQNYSTQHIPSSVNLPEYKTKDIESYSSGRYLWPTYWIPFVATSSNSNGYFLQAQTSGHDPIHIHDYSAVLNYETELKKGGFLGTYTNSSWSWPINAAVSVRNQAFGDATQIVETKTGALALQPDLFKLSQNLKALIGAEYQETNFFGSQTKHWGPFFTLQYIDYSQSIFEISPDNGWGAFLKYENKINLDNSRDYNKVTSSLVGYFSPWLPDRHVMMARASSLLTFESISARFGTSNGSLFFQSDNILPQFILRGYQPSQFFGRSMWNFNFEYRFPVSQLNRGSGTDAYFLKRLSAALVSDGLGVEGASVAEDGTVYRNRLNESFWSTGAELKLETTLGYILPVQFVLGVYLPYSPLYSSSVQTGLSLQISGF